METLPKSILIRISRAIRGETPLEMCIFPRKTINSLHKSDVCTEWADVVLGSEIVPIVIAFSYAKNNLKLSSHELRI